MTLRSLSFVLPGWAREHFAIVLALALIVAIVLRVTPRDTGAADPAHSEHYLPVAAAIGLSQDVPPDAALATWISAGLYAVRYGIVSLISPGTTAVDFCAGFIRDPEHFCALADAAALMAGVISIYLAWVVVSRLLDPVAGLAAAFVIAVHPAAIAHTSGVNSGAFALLFLLCGLAIATKVRWRSARRIEFATVGLCLGFALDAIPLAAPILVAIIIMSIRATPGPQRGRLPDRIAIAIAAFGLAAAAVIPAAPPLIEMLLIALLSAAVVAALLLAGHALRSLREIVSETTYSSALLLLVLAVGIFAVTSFRPPGAGPLDEPGILASNWLVAYAPPGASIVVDSGLERSTALPRSPRSWLRQFEHSRSAPSTARFYALAAARAAAEVAGPSFDVHVCAASGAPCPAARGGHAEAQYLVLPDGADPSGFASEGSWLVARFRSRVEGQPGVAIWGTQAAPDVRPVRVEWRMGGDRMLAAAPSSG